MLTKHCYNIQVSESEIEIQAFSKQEKKENFDFFLSRFKTRQNVFYQSEPIFFGKDMKWSDKPLSFSLSHPQRQFWILMKILAANFFIVRRKNNFLRASFSGIKIKTQLDSSLEQRRLGLAISGDFHFV